MTTKTPEPRPPRYPSSAEIRQAFHFAVDLAIGLPRLPSDLFPLADFRALIKLKLDQADIPAAVFRPHHWQSIWFVYQAAAGTPLARFEPLTVTVPTPHYPVTDHHRLERETHALNRDAGSACSMCGAALEDPDEPFCPDCAGIDSADLRAFQEEQIRDAESRSAPVDSMERGNS